MKRARRIFLIGAIVIALFLILNILPITIIEAASTASSSPAPEVNTNYTTRYLPDILKGAAGPADMVFLIYKYLMGLVGVVAVGVIMYGGVLRTISADPSKIKVSNEYIRNAIKGIVLLFGAQVLFNTINPNIIDIARIQKALQPQEKINPKPFVPIDIELPSSGTSTPSQQDVMDIYGGLPGFADLAAKIQPCSGCGETFGNSFSVKSGACYGQKCLLNKGLISKLNNLQTRTTSWRVTEVYPPTVNHSSSCHFDGTCVDIALTTSATALSVNALIDVARATGFTVVNEYSVGNNPQKFETTTGGHLHLR